MKSLLLLFMVLNSPSHVPALRCRECIYENPAILFSNVYPSSICLNSSFPEAVCADYQTDCMTVTGVMCDQGVTEVHFELGGCSNSSSCHGQPYDMCDLTNATLNGFLKSCSYWCCSGDLCNYLNITSPGHTTSSVSQFSTSTVSIHPTTASQVQIGATKAISTAVTQVQMGGHQGHFHGSHPSTGGGHRGHFHGSHPSTGGSHRGHFHGSHPITCGSHRGHFHDS